MNCTSASRFTLMLLIPTLAGISAGCSRQAAETATAKTTATAAGAQATTRQSTCDEDNGSITLPSGFCATVFADNIGHARHLVVTPGGDVYVNTWIHKDLSGQIPANPPGGFVVALRDADRDGHGAPPERDELGVRGRIVLDVSLDKRAALS